MEFGKLGGAGVEVTQFPEKLGDQSYVWDRQELPIVNWDVGEIEAVGTSKPQKRWILENDQLITSSNRSNSGSFHSISDIQT